MLEVFKDIINKSSHPLNEELKVKGLEEEKVESNSVKDTVLKPRYVVSVILEFLRSLLENQIP